MGREVARVLKPGCHVVIWDISHTAEYAAVLRECGLTVRNAGTTYTFVIP